MVIGDLEVLTGLTGLLGIAVCGLAAALVACRRGLARERRRRAELSDGAVIRAEDGVILDLSDEAAGLPGVRPGARLAGVVPALFAATDRPGVEAALARLIDEGEAFGLMAARTSGEPVELVGRPEGGQSVLVLRDARLAATAIARAEAELARGERSLSAAGHERETLAALTDCDRLIAWHRAEDDRILWSAGQIRAEHGLIGAGRALGALPPRANRSDAPAGPRIDRFRVEIMPEGANEPVPLCMVEVTRADGRRFGFATDASIARSAERTLARFMQTMTETFAHLAAGLAIFDRNQALVLFNPALARMLRLDPAWLAGRPTLRDLIDTLRNARRLPETEDFHLWRRRLLDLFNDPDAAAYDETWHLADGSSISVLARPHPHGALAFVFDDVSEQMRLEQNYRQSVDLRHATLNRLEEGLAVFGADGRLQFVNDAFHEIWSTDSESVHAGMHAREVIELCQGLSVETDVWRRVIGFITSDETRRAWSARVTLGSSRTLSARLAPLPGGATMVVLADITDSERIAHALRERNEALEAVEEMRSAVLDQISHRLRTPLNTIFGYGQLLGDPRFGELSADQREYADGILEASGQLLDTIDDVTELASLQFDPLHDGGGEPALAETLELTRQLLEKRAVEAGVQLVAELPDTGLMVRCEGARLRQIVFNMVAGAIQRSPAGTRILLDTASDGPERIEIRVTERRGAGDAAADTAEDDAALTFSVIRRMVASEGGRFERRQGPGPNEIATVCSFATGPREATGAGEPETGAIAPARLRRSR